MLESIFDDLKREFRSGHMVTRIIIVNVIVWISLNMLLLIFKLTNAGSTPEVYLDIRNFFLISNDLVHVLTHPWAFVTTNFIHEGFGHIFWNMLLFYWFGKIVGDLIGDRKILPLYLLAGFAGCLAYFIGMNIGDNNITPALGASASVMGVIVAAGVLSPDYVFNLIFIGPVKMKWVVLILVLIDVFALGKGAGGPIAHLGGAAFGAFFVSQMRSGRDWSEPVNRLIDKIRNFFGGLQAVEVGRSKRKGKRKSDNENISASHQERVDEILDKIKAQGYESLTEEEKEFLFLASKK